MNTPLNIIVGIDLGTTNSLVAYADAAGPRVIEDDHEASLPSVVAFDDAGNVSTTTAPLASGPPLATLTEYVICSVVVTGSAASVCVTDRSASERVVKRVSFQPPCGIVNQRPADWNGETAGSYRWRTRQW